MDLFEALEWSRWKTLSLELKSQVINQVLMYFVSPLKKISEVNYQQFELDGVKCSTFECTIDGERFVLVPGNKAAILGWNAGIAGIAHDAWDTLGDDSDKIYRAARKNYGLQTAQEWTDYVNELTSPLRKVVIPPMLIQKKARPAGTTYVGDLNMITGEFKGDKEAFSAIEAEISKHFKQPASFEESLTMEIPNEIFAENNFYAILSDKRETYAIYQHQNCSLNSLRKQVQAQVFDLPTEDQWEYALSAATRKLFRWGNDLREDQSYYGEKVSQGICQANMFGLKFSHALNHWELTDDNYLKLEKLVKVGNDLYDHLPLASYYRSHKLIAAEDLLAPCDYYFRKVILIQNH